MIERYRHLTVAAARGLVPLAALLFLQACGSTEEDEGGPAGAGPSGDDAEYDAELEGSVGDGPIAAASLRIVANDGTVLSESVSDQDATYSVQFKTKGKYYPLTIESSGGIDLVTNEAPGFTLLSVAAGPRNKATVNINPFTTLAVASAQQMSGGMTAANVSVALDAVMREFNSGLTSALSIDPLTTPISDSSLAEVVKSSEALAEIFKRVHSGVAQSGETLDDVIHAIAGDLADGVIDGNGSIAADPRISALTVVASSQVMLEAMRNEIHVDGEIATPVLDTIVEQLATSANPPLTGSRPITSQMIAQARRGIDAAIALGESAALTTLRADLDTIAAGMSADDARTLLEPDAGVSLTSTLVALESASEAEITATLAGVTPTTPPAPANSVPVISGVPPASVTQGIEYVFTPMVIDPDGDTLLFRISGLPVWAAFEAATGRLSGTPSGAHIGVYGPIVISVSDGIGSAALPPFSITVEAADTPPVTPPPPPPDPSNTAPVISGTPATRVDEGVTYSFQPTASDADGDALTFGITGRPAWASFNSSTGRLIGTPSSANVGTFGPIVISVSDGVATTALSPFSITVEAAAPQPNAAPTISGNPAGSISAGAAYAFTPTANDADGDPLSFQISGRPAWASFNTSTGRLSGTPTNADAGTFGPIVISVSDGTDSASLAAFSITVQPVEPGSATLSWTPPTENTDGSPLTDLAGYRLRWGQQSGNYTDSVTLMNPGVTTYVVEPLLPGTYYFAVMAVNSSGVESAPSNEASKTIN